MLRAPTWAFCMQSMHSDYLAISLALMPNFYEGKFSSILWGVGGWLSMTGLVNFHNMVVSSLRSCLYNKKSQTQSKPPHPFSSGVCASCFSHPSKRKLRFLQEGKRQLAWGSRSRSQLPRLTKDNKMGHWYSGWQAPVGISGQGASALSIVPLQEKAGS